MLLESNFVEGLDHTRLTRLKDIVGCGGPVIRRILTVHNGPHGLSMGMVESGLAHSPKEDAGGDHS